MRRLSLHEIDNNNKPIQAHLRICSPGLQYVPKHEPRAARQPRGVEYLPVGVVTAVSGDWLYRS